jgi:hypothetical protein
MPSAFDAAFVLMFPGGDASSGWLVDMRSHFPEA